MNTRDRNKLHGEIIRGRPPNPKRTTKKKVRWTPRPNEDPTLDARLKTGFRMLRGGQPW